MAISDNVHACNLQIAKLRTAPVERKFVNIDVPITERHGNQYFCEEWIEWKQIHF